MKLLARKSSYPTKPARGWRSKKPRTITAMPPQKEGVIETRRHARRGEKYLIQIEYMPELNRYRRYDTWSDLDAATLYRMGYKDAIRFHDNLRYSGVPTYIMLKGFRVADPTVADEEHGRRANYETSSTLADFYTSDAAEDFKKGLTTTKFSPIETKQLITIIPIILGVILGVYFLMK